MLLKVMSTSILTYSDIIRKAAETIIIDCTEKHISNLFKNLLLDVYQLWVWVEDDKIDTILITTISENFLVTDNILSIVCLYSETGITADTIIKMRDTLIPYMVKNNCKIMNILATKEHVKRLVSLLEPSYEATYYQVNI